MVVYVRILELTPKPPFWVRVNCFIRQKQASFLYKHFILFYMTQTNICILYNQTDMKPPLLDKGHFMDHQEHFSWFSLKSEWFILYYSPFPYSLEEELCQSPETYHLCRMWRGSHADICIMYHIHCLIRYSDSVCLCRGSAQTLFDFLKYFLPFSFSHCLCFWFCRLSFLNLRDITSSLFNKLCRRTSMCTVEPHYTGTYNLF